MGRKVEWRGSGGWMEWNGVDISMELVVWRLGGEGVLNAVEWREKMGLKWSEEEGRRNVEKGLERVESKKGWEYRGVRVGSREEYGVGVERSQLGSREEYRLGVERSMGWK